MASRNYRHTLEELSYDMRFGMEESDLSHLAENEEIYDNGDLDGQMSNYSWMQPVLVSHQAHRFNVPQDQENRFHEVNGMHSFSQTSSDQYSTTHTEKMCTDIDIISQETSAQLEAVYMLEGVPEDDLLLDLSDHLQIGIITLHTWFIQRKNEDL